MALECSVHAMVQQGQLTRIKANQVRSQFTQTSPDTFGIGRQVEWTERTDFTIACESSIGFHSDNCTVKHCHRLAAGPAVFAFHQR